MPLPIDVVGELAKCLRSRGLDPDPEDIGNQSAFLLGKASDAALRAPGLNTGQQFDPREGIAATTFYDQVKAFFTGRADALQEQDDARGDLRRPARIGCGIRTRATRLQAACRSRSRRRTWGMHRLRPRRSTSRPKRRRMKAVDKFWQK